jgi:hypothetical protein
MEVLTMFGKNRNKKVGLCVMVVTACLVLAALWAVLATPETALAEKGGKGKGGGDFKDIPVCIEGLAGGVKTDDGNYCASERGVTAFVGRRRAIKLGFKKNSNRTIFLTLGSPMATIDGDPSQPSGEKPTLSGGKMVEPEFRVALLQNVSNMAVESKLQTTGRLTFLDENGTVWGLFWGPNDWAGGFDLTNTENAAPPVSVERMPDTDEGLRKWSVTTTGDNRAYLWKGAWWDYPDFASVYNVSFAYTATEEP